MARPSPLFFTPILALLAAMTFAIPDATYARQERGEEGGAGNLKTDAPILFQADELTHDRELGIVHASGHVEVTHADQILLADTITYNERDDMLTATGNVSLTQPSGEVMFADYFEVTGDLKNGTIRDLRVIMADGSRVAAAGGRRVGGVVNEFNNGVYSPCELCTTDRNRPPLWQVKAVRVVHDNEKHTVVYRDAWLEVAGVPVMYTPYLSHPDPTVKRKSGLLPPSFGNSSDLGVIVRTPYYFSVSPQMDATLTPMYTSNEGAVAIGQFRHHLANGLYRIDASLTEDSEDEVRGHIDAMGRYELNETWRLGADIQRATDDTYQRRYQFDSDSPLESRLFAEGFRGRNYAVANAYAYQNLRADSDPEQSPIVLPMIEYHHIGQPSVVGGRTNLDANMTVLTRDDGVNMRRASVAGGWQLPYTAPAGDVYTLSASLRGDAYHVEGVSRDDRDDFTGFTGRIVPELGLHWRYPFIKDQDSIHQIFEPIASMIVSPYGGNPDSIPNEDSVEFEFDDTNLFEGNRFSGLDRVEGGPRANYGVHWGVFGNKGGYSDILVGQSVRMQSDDTFTEGSGLDDRISDVVTRIRVSPGRMVDLTYRGRFDKDNLAARRNELTTTVGSRALKISLGYSFYDGKAGSEYGDREQLQSLISSQFTKFWRGYFSSNNDLAAGGDTLSNGLGLTYEDECLTFSVTGSRTYFQDRDLQPTDSVMFRVVFKTLGEVKTGAF